MDDSARSMLQFASFLGSNKAVPQTPETHSLNQNQKAFPQLASQALKNDNKTRYQVRKAPGHQQRDQTRQPQTNMLRTNNLSNNNLNQTRFLNNQSHPESRGQESGSGISRNTQVLDAVQRAPGRTLGFPGNPNRLGLNTSNPRVLHALRLLKKRNRLKRGPKEKETFQRYFYCLPNKYAKLPKFSSLDPIEKAVVRQHQEAGYGYPPGDFNDGFPRKTSIYLNYSAEKFHKFIVTMFPVVENKLYDLYRIDKQRRLIRIDVRTPRAIKDLKYQGTIVVIPYEDETDRAPHILFRSGEEFFLHMPSSTSPSLDHNLFMSSNSDLLRPLSPESNDLSQNHEINTDQSYNTENEAEMFLDPSCIKREPDIASLEDLDLQTENTDGIPSETEEVNTRQSLDYTQEKCKIFAIAKTLRNRLKPSITIRVRKSCIMSDVLEIYRTNSEITGHKLSVCYTEEVDAMKEQCLSMFSLFWSQVLRSNFNGDQEVVPSTDLNIEDDFYFLLGKILYHGVVLYDYWPVKFSQACMAAILNNTCSERQLITSFHHVITESDRAIIGITKKEFREHGGNVPMATFRNFCKVLRFYGCKQKPELPLLDQLLLKVANFHLVKEPYWQLMQMREGLNATDEDIFRYVNENDIFTFYSLLIPNALSLFNKVIFIHSSDASSMEMEEKRVKLNFESFIMQLNTEKLCNFLFQWCYSDCLCVDQLCVQFDPSTMSGVPIFKPEQSTLVLSSMYMSKEELHHLLSTFVSH